MTTPPDRIVGVRSSRLPSCLPALMSMGWLRSDFLAIASGLAAMATATSSQLAALVYLRGIAGFDLRLERVLLGGQVHFQPVAAEYRAGPVDGDLDRGVDAIGVGVHVQLLGIDGDLGCLLTLTDCIDVTTQAQLVTV